MESKRSELRQYLEALLIAAIFLGFSNTFVVKTFYIPSGSMRETLEIGDHLFVNRYAFGPMASKLERWLTPARDVRRGDVVIFRSLEEPKNDLVKRCIGLPGDEILIIDKQLFINRQKVDDSSYTIHRDSQIKPRPPAQGNRQGSYAYSVRDNFGPVVVPADHYFFLGDNRDESYDSRFWGFVPRHYVKGRAFVIYWSYGGEVSDGSWRGWKNKTTEVAHTVVGFFTNTRWERSFHLVR